MLGIEIDKTLVAKVGQAVAESYIKPVDISVTEGQTDTEDQDAANEVIDSQSCANVTAEGFLAEKLRELDARSDRDAIIQAAINGKIDGVEGAEATLSALYLSADGTGVPGLRRELSDNGKNGGGRTCPVYGQ